MVHIIFYLLLGTPFLMSCGNSAKNSPSIERPLETNKRQQSVSTADGLFLNEWNNSGILVILNQKIHHFNKTNSIDVYKDEEYNFSSIDDDGFLVIQTRYFQDRNDDIKEKKTLLRDIQLVKDGGKVVSLVRNGRTFRRLNTFQDLMVELSLDLNHLQSNCPLSSEESQQIVSDPHYYANLGLVSRALYDGDISFSDMFCHLAR